jgi:hypothetical protein
MTLFKTLLLIFPILTLQAKQITFSEDSRTIYFDTKDKVTLSCEAILTRLYDAQKRSVKAGRIVKTSWDSKKSRQHLWLDSKVLPKSMIDLFGVKSPTLYLYFDTEAFTKKRRTYNLKAKDGLLGGLKSSLKLKSKGKQCLISHKGKINNRLSILPNELVEKLATKAISQFFQSMKKMPKVGR